jgi:DNA integrity scanning protein DisA with diadenylate cyclase activity
MGKIDSVIEINESINNVSAYSMNTNNCLNDFHFRSISLEDLWATIEKIKTTCGQCKCKCIERCVSDCW